MQNSSAANSFSPRRLQNKVGSSVGPKVAKKNLKSRQDLILWFEFVLIFNYD